MIHVARRIKERSETMRSLLVILNTLVLLPGIAASQDSGPEPKFDVEIGQCFRYEIEETLDFVGSGYFEDSTETQTLITLEVKDIREGLVIFGGHIEGQREQSTGLINGESRSTDLGDGKSTLSASLEKLAATIEVDMSGKITKLTGLVNPEKKEWQDTRIAKQMEHYLRMPFTAIPLKAVQPQSSWTERATLDIGASPYGRGTSPVAIEWTNRVATVSAESIVLKAVARRITSETEAEQISYSKFVVERDLTVDAKTGMLRSCAAKAKTIVTSPGRNGRTPKVVETIAFSRIRAVVAPKATERMDRLAPTKGK